MAENKEEQKKQEEQKKKQKKGKIKGDPCCEIY